MNLFRVFYNLFILKSSAQKHIFDWLFIFNHLQKTLNRFHTNTFRVADLCAGSGQ